MAGGDAAVEAAETDAVVVHIKGEGGTIFAMSLPLPEAIADRMVKGYIKRVNADGSPYVETEADEVPAPPTDRPSVNALKADWVAWAVVNGMTPDDAEALTKPDLIDRFGA